MNNNLYIQHHGILGMKWGVRRYQNPDGTLTAAGRARQAKEESKKKMENELTDSYKRQGYSEQEAEKMVKGLSRTKKALLIAGGVTLAAAAAYVGWRYYDKNVDSIIKPGQIVRTVFDKSQSIDDRIGGERFYSSFKEGDKLLYSSRIFSHLTDKSQIADLKIGSKLKIASRGSQEKIFKELMKTDQDFARYAKSIPWYEDAPTHFRRFQKHLVLNDKTNPLKSKAQKLYYDTLKSKGYHGIIDVEDSFNEGHWTSKPVIIFGGQNFKNKIVSKTVRDPSIKELADKGKRYRLAEIKYLLNTGSYNTKAVAKGFLYTEGIIGLSYLGKKTEPKKARDLADRIDRYIKDHPETKMSRSQLREKFENEY